MIRERSAIVLITTLWFILIILIFLQNSQIIKISILDFPQSKGHIDMLQSGYHDHNILGLNGIVYAVPFGTPFIHPARIKEMDQLKIYRSYSIEEIKSMIHQQNQNIPNKLQLIKERYRGYSFYQRHNKIYALTAFDQEWGKPLSPNPYKEFPVGNNLKEAEEYIDQKLKGN